MKYKCNLQEIFCVYRESPAVFIVGRLRIFARSVFANCVAGLPVMATEKA